MCPIFILKHKSVTMLVDEHPTPPNGTLFPLPYYAPRWMGYNATSQDAGQGSNGQTPVAQGPGDADMNVDDIDLDQQAEDKILR